MKRAGVLIIVSLLLLSCSVSLVQSDEPQYEKLFGFYIRSLTENSEKIQLGLLAEERYPQIGIECIYVPPDNWDPWPDPWIWIDFDYIPTHNEGGYDALLIRHKSGLEWDPTGMFETSALVPFGDNFYQYTNPIYDDLLIQYLTAINQTLQNQYAQEMQAIIYDDLPTIVLTYPKTLFGFKQEITGVDNQLILSSFARTEYWDDPEDHILSYGFPDTLVNENIYKDDFGRKDLWMQAVYGSLFKRDQDSHAWLPFLALDYEISSDLKNYTINLDPNAKFSDGSPVLAEDVEYSVRLHMTPDVGSSSYSYLNTWLASNSSVEVINDHTINFNLTDGNAFAKATLSFGIIDKSSVEPLIGTHGYSIFDEHPLTGNVGDALVKSFGPFKLNSINLAQGTVNLTPNPYWNNLTSSGGIQPLLDELNLTQIQGRSNAISELLAGAIDIADSNYDFSLEELIGIGIEGRTADSFEYYEFALNMRHPIFGTGELTPLATAEAAKNVRKAFSHIIPRDLIVNNIFNGLAHQGITIAPPGCVGFNTQLEPYEYNVTLAIEYLEKAGFELIEITPTTTKTSFVILVVMTIGLTTLGLVRGRKK